MDKRKVIQIATAPETNSRYGQLFVLCDTGDLYVAPYQENEDFTNPEWQKIKTPQPEND